ncbi:MAG: outer-membrane lipoprotein carrier protein LolA, partial [Gammaproteobacteria bacterium]|nr:outer-membrane lipoprotein carrier protein LolA [Gammaproteobacteria bacterium]
DDTVTRDFNVSQQVSGKTIIFDLKSKSSKENFQHIKLVFTQDNLTGLELHDQLGQVTTVQLVQIKSNPLLPAKLFQFKPPKGADLVQQ